MTTTDPQMMPTRFGFLLLENFTLISVSSAIETLRMANRVAGNEVYSWRMISESGGPVSASDGLSISADSSIGDDGLSSDLDAVIACGGERVERHCEKTAMHWLRACNARGVALGSTCTGSYALAKAGVLDGYRCSVHWEEYAAMTEQFPKVTVNRSIFTIDRDRFTSSGGTAPMDMMLYFVRRQLGAGISAEIADQFVHDRIRDSRDRQHVPLRHQVGGHSAKLVAAVELMESNIREPLSQVELASYVGLSRRQLQRLFQKYLLTSPSRYYLYLRLARARELLFQTSLSIVEISAQSGFVSSSHFSTTYRELYGKTPSVDRADR